MGLLMAMDEFEANKWFALLAIVLATWIPAMAQESDRLKIDVGVQVSYTWRPTPNDLYDNDPRNGFGVGAFIELVWSDFWGVRGQYEYTKFDDYQEYNAPTPYYSYYTDVSMSSNMAIIDLMVFPRQKYVPYFFGGFGIGRSHRDPRLWSGTDVEGSLHFGVGWKLPKQFGVEVKSGVYSFGNSRVIASMLYRF
jgi:hypothetical protein